MSRLKVEEGRAITVQGDGKFRGWRKISELWTIGEVCVGLQKDLNDRGIIAKGGNVNDGSARIARAVIVGGRVDSAVGDHDDEGTVGVPGGESFDGRGFRCG